MKCGYLVRVLWWCVGGMAVVVRVGGGAGVRGVLRVACCVLRVFRLFVFCVRWMCVACCGCAVLGVCGGWRCWGEGEGAGGGSSGWSVWVFNAYLWAGCAGGSSSVLVEAWGVGGDAAARAPVRGAAAWCSVFLCVPVWVVVCVFRVLRAAVCGRRGARGRKEVLLPLERRRRCDCGVCKGYCGVGRRALRRRVW